MSRSTSPWVAPWRAAGMLLLAACGVASAQPEPPMHAVPLAAGEVLRLDGRLDHPAWQRAPLYSHFVEHQPRPGAEPPQATQVRLLYDGRALYVGIHARDTEPQHIREVLVRADQVNRTQDFVVVYIDAIGARRSAQFFRVNAAGSTADGIHTAADDSEDFAPDFDWDGAAARDADGWTAVLRLPFASLRYAEGDQDRWRIMVARRLPREQYHLMTSVEVPRSAPSFIDRLQPLSGVRLPEDHHFLTLRPSLTLRREHQVGADGTRRNDHATDASLDLKWRARAELVLDGTLNPDFSQVALDVPQLQGNTRFALSLLEKRPFFFESADLLRSPTEAFYTRSFTEPRWGLRATWRGNTLAGSAFAIDDRGGGLVLLPGAYGTGAAPQPASRTLAARVRSDHGALQWGGVLAARRYADGGGDNTVLGPDLNWRLAGPWRLRAQALYAQTSAQADGQRGLAAGERRSGTRLFVRADRLTDSAETVLTAEDIGSGFRHDSGFVAQAGIRKVSLFQSLGWRPLGPFNEFFVNLNVVRTEERASGRLIEQQVFPGLWSAAAHNLEWWLELHGLERTRPSAQAPLLRPRYVASGLVVSPSSWFPLLDTKVELGRLADAVAVQTRPGLRWTTTLRLRPLRWLELEPFVSRAWLRADGTRRYDETVAQLLAVWHLGPRSHLRAIVQHNRLQRLAEPGVDTLRDGSRVASLTWSWRHSAGTVLYVGATRSRPGPDRLPRGSEAFVKFQFDVDEVRGLMTPGA